MSFSSSQRYITIATDISAFEPMNIWTWACYIRWSGGVIKQTGEFKTIPKTTTEAETFALCNALVLAYANVPFWEQSRVIIHNEIEIVLEPMAAHSKKQHVINRDKRRAKAIVNVALPLLDLAQSWERRKIKAHFKDWKESENPAKYAINRWCDMESRRLMKTIRKQRKQALK